MDRNPDDNPSKQQLYNFANFLRRQQRFHQPCGTIGFEGGIDGEMSSAAMWEIIQEVKRNSKFVDPRKYGIDIGTGSGATSFIHFNFNLNLPMVGAECNDYRCDYSWRFHQTLSTLSGEDVKRVSNMTLLLFGDASEVLEENLGPSPVFASLINWFSNGWRPDDIRKVVMYLITFRNLEWIITNLSQEELIQYGFARDSFMGLSAQHSGKLVNSSSTRTLFVHHLRLRYSMTGIVCSEMESLIVGSFKSKDVVVEFSKQNSLEMAEVSEKAKKVRGKVKHRKVVKANNSFYPIYKMRPFKTFLSDAQIRRFQRMRFSIEQQTPTVERVQPAYRETKTRRIISKRPQNIKLQHELDPASSDSSSKLSSSSSSVSSSSLFGKCFGWLFGTKFR